MVLKGSRKVGLRLSGAFGSLYGVKIPENLADDMPDEKDLPYLEMLYRFVFGKKSYYDLEMTRHVEPQGGERSGVGGASTTATERDTAGGSSNHGRKPRWKLPPKTIVRLKNRMHRWDGFLYNIDLFHIYL